MLLYLHENVGLFNHLRNCNVSIILWSFEVRSVAFNYLQSHESPVFDVLTKTRMSALNPQKNVSSIVIIELYVTMFRFGKMVVDQRNTT